MARTNYKKIEIEIREMVQSGRQNIYEIATRCVQLFNECDNYAAAVNLNPDDVLQHLNEYLKDFAVDLSTVITLLKMFPSKEQWNKPLLDLLDDANAAIRATATDSEMPVRARRTYTRADKETAETQIAEQAVLLNRKDAELTRKDSEIERLRAENARLIAANEKLTERVAKLEGQVSELRRIAKEPVAV